MDEQTSYILTTCSISATHLSMEDGQLNAKMMNDKSIDLLESLLGDP